MKKKTGAYLRKSKKGWVLIETLRPNQDTPEAFFYELFQFPYEGQQPEPRRHAIPHWRKV